MLFPPIYLWARFASCQKLVLLGTDFVKSDGWHTRFKLNAKGGSIVIPCALKDRFGKQIQEVQFSNAGMFFGKLEKTLQQLYGRRPQFAAVMEAIEWRDKGDTFGDYCTSTMQRIARYLHLLVKIEEIQNLTGHRPKDASEWLAEIGCFVGGTEYVCAADAPEKYLNTKPFDDRSISISKQYYRMPAYPGSTDACASILDLLFRCSVEEARKVLQCE